jgi:hypothetical protein
MDIHHIFTICHQTETEISFKKSRTRFQYIGFFYDFLTPTFLTEQQKEATFEVGEK